MTSNHPFSLASGVKTEGNSTPESLDLDWIGFEAGAEWGERSIENAWSVALEAAGLEAESSGTGASQGLLFAESGGPLPAFVQGCMNLEPGNEPWLPLRLIVARQRSGRMLMAWCFSRLHFGEEAIAGVLQRFFQSRGSCWEGPERAFHSRQADSGRHPPSTAIQAGDTPITRLMLDNAAHSTPQTGTGEFQTHATCQGTESLVDYARQHGLSMDTLVSGIWALLLNRHGGATEVVCCTGLSAEEAGAFAAPGGVTLMLSRWEVNREAVLLPWLSHPPRKWSERRPSIGIDTGQTSAEAGLTSVPPVEGVCQFHPVSLEGLPGECFPGAGPVVFRTRQSDVPLTLDVCGGRRFAIKASFHKECFHPDAIRQLVGEFVALLETLPGLSGSRLGCLPWMTDAEQNRVLIAWNESDTPFPRDSCVHEILEEQSCRMSDTAAVVFGDESLTHGELNERSNALALTLQKLGIVPDSRVAILVERSLEMIVGLLAIWKAGGAYVPLDSTYPKDRLKSMLHDSGARVLLTQKHSEIASELEASGLQILHLEEHQGRSKRPPRTLVTAPHLAYVMYTSGSTGRPKGVMVTHRNVLNFFAAMDQQIGMDPGVWLAVTSISFDISVLELFWTLARGFKVIIQPSGAGALAPASGLTVPKQILRHGVTHFQCTPSLMRGLLADPEMPPAIRSLKRLLLGGEALPGSLAKALHELIPDGFFNLYGPTETTVWSSVHKMSGESETIPIGRPIANTQIYLLHDLQPVAVGAVGEIVIGGEGVTRGYFNREALTEEKFVPDPFRAGPGRRLYRTGDLGRWLPDGTLQCLGRLDHQVKLRGQRIELGEIECALQSCPGVLDVVVVAREDEGKGPELVAYIVRGPATFTPADEGQNRFQDRSTDFDTAWGSTDSAPALPGSLDRASQGTPGPGILVNSGPVDNEARSRWQGRIVNIWAEMLGVDAGSIGLHDNFFDLGGHSLLVVQIQVRLNEDLGIQVPLAKLFQHTTPSSLLDFLNGSIAAPVDNTQRRGLLKQRHHNLVRKIEGATA